MVPEALRSLSFVWGQFLKTNTDGSCPRDLEMLLLLIILSSSYVTQRRLGEHHVFVSPGDVRHCLQREEQAHRELGGLEGDQAGAR